MSTSLLPLLSAALSHCPPIGLLADALATKAANALTAGDLDAAHEAVDMWGSEALGARKGDLWNDPELAHSIAAMSGLLAAIEAAAIARDEAMVRAESISPMAVAS